MIRGEGRKHAMFNQDPWRLGVASGLFDIASNFDPRAVDNRNFGRRQLSRDLVTVRAVFDDQTHREFLRDTDRRHDVVGPMGVSAKRDRFFNHCDQRFHAQIPLAFALHVIVSFDQRLAEYCRNAHAGHGTFFPVSVGAFGALAKRNFHAHRSGDKHFFQGSSHHFDRGGLSAHHVVTTGHDPDGRDAAFERVAKADVFRIDRIDGADLRDHWIIHLVFIALVGADSVLPEAEMRVRVDHSGNHYFSLEIPNLGALWNSHTGADFLNGWIADQNAAVLNISSSCGHYEG